MNVLDSCRTDVSKQKFADSQMSMANSFFVAAVLSIFAYAGKVLEDFSVNWRSFLFLTVAGGGLFFAARMRERALEIFDGIEEEKQRRLDEI